MLPVCLPVDFLDRKCPLPLWAVADNLGRTCPLPLWAVADNLHKARPVVADNLYKVIPPVVLADIPDRICPLPLAVGSSGKSLPVPVAASTPVGVRHNWVVVGVLGRYQAAVRPCNTVGSRTPDVLPWADTSCPLDRMNPVLQVPVSHCPLTVSPPVWPWVY